MMRRRLTALLAAALFGLTVGEVVLAAKEPAPVQVKVVAGSNILNL